MSVMDSNVQTSRTGLVELKKDLFRDVLWFRIGRLKSDL